MSTLIDPRSNTERAIIATIRTYWVLCLFLVQATIMTALGAAAIVWPQVSTLAVDLYAVTLALMLIAFFIIEGIFQIALQSQMQEHANANR